MEHMIPDVPLVSLPVPIYLPSPSPSYRLFKPKAIPVPVPVFVPVMIPVTKRAYKDIREYLQVSQFTCFLILKCSLEYCFRLVVIFYQMIRTRQH